VSFYALVSPMLFHNKPLYIVMNVMYTILVILVICFGVAATKKDVEDHSVII